MNDPPVDDPKQYDALTRDEQEVLQEWIWLVVRPANRIAFATSYGMKHDFEAAGFYVTNGAFKGAMQRAGYAPVDPAEKNWRFRCRPFRKPSLCAGGPENGVTYGLWSLSPAQRGTFDALMVRVTGREQGG